MGSEEGLTSGEMPDGGYLFDVAVGGFLALVAFVASALVLLWVVVG